MVRWLVRALAILVIVVAALVVLDFAELLVPVGPDDSASRSTTPADSGSRRTGHATVANRT